METRRRFIQKSAFAVGVLGGVAIPVTAGAAPPVLDPALYPWSVTVDGRAQASLYLVQGISLRHLFQDPLRDTFDNMRTNAEQASGTDLTSLVAAINSGGGAYTRDDLVARIVAARNALDASSNPSISYLRFASIKHQQLNPQYIDVWNAANPHLVALAELICVPVLQTNPVDVNDFRIRHGVSDDIDHHGAAGRDLRDLFVTKYSGINRQPRPGGSKELRLWHETRDLGLLWCGPRMRHLSSLQPDLPEPIVPRTFIHGNGWRCDLTTHKCWQPHPPHPDDYCQEIDGACNAMGG